MTSPNPLVKICGCSYRKVAVGTPFEGISHNYCPLHTPYKNVYKTSQAKNQLDASKEVR